MTARDAEAIQAAVEAASEAAEYDAMHWGADVYVVNWPTVVERVLQVYASTLEAPTARDQR